MSVNTNELYLKYFLRGLVIIPNGGDKPMLYFVWYETMFVNSLAVER